MEGFRKNYSYADFDRYYRGNMSKEEQFRFEYTLLEDPFLRDAYEGFEEMQKDGKSPSLTVSSVKELIGKKRTEYSCQEVVFRSGSCHSFCDRGAVGVTMVSASG